MHLSTKTYGHEVGLSCCFRQHKAVHSHCSSLHGYAIAVKLTFGADELDDKNWVMDFGGLKKVKEFLVETFDHTVLVAEDDPFLDEITALQGLGIARVVVLEQVGCEAFAQLIYEKVEAMLPIVLNQGFRVRIISVEVKEHGANSAIYCL